VNQFDEQFIITELSLSRSVVGQLEMSILVGAFKSTQSQSINFFPTKNRNLTEIEKFIRVFNCANTIVPSLSLNLCYNMVHNRRKLYCRLFHFNLPDIFLLISLWQQSLSSQRTNMADPSRKF